MFHLTLCHETYQESLSDLVMQEWIESSVMRFHNVLIILLTIDSKLIINQIYIEKLCKGDEWGGGSTDHLRKLMDCNYELMEPPIMVVSHSKV